MSLKIERLDDERGSAIGKWRVVFTPKQMWSEWFGSGWNWRNFSLIQCEWEVSDYIGRRVEIEVALLGFYVHVEVYDAVERAIALQPIHEARIKFIEGWGEAE